MLLPVGTEAFRDAQSFDVVRERKKKLVKREVSHPILLRFDGKSQDCALWIARAKGQAEQGQAKRPRGTSPSAKKQKLQKLDFKNREIDW